MILLRQRQWPTHTLLSSLLANQFTSPIQKKITITCTMEDGQHMRVCLYPKASVRKIKYGIQHRLGFDISDLRLVYDGRQLDDERSIEEYEITEGDYIQGYRVFLGKKPVIYVLSPSVMDVTVSLHLVPEWSFSAI
jgi:hypothetical protein